MTTSRQINEQLATASFKGAMFVGSIAPFLIPNISNWSFYIMGFASRYKTDKVAEAEGVWVDFGDSIEVKLARLNNKDAKEMRRKLEKPYKNFKELPEDVSEEILIKLVAHTVIKGWKGIELDGKEIAYSAEDAIKVLKEYPDFFNDVVNASVAKETYSVNEAADSKNS